jgi:hypothetical protein
MVRSERALAPTLLTHPSDGSVAEPSHITNNSQLAR